MYGCEYQCATCGVPIGQIAGRCKFCLDLDREGAAAFEALLLGDEPSEAAESMPAARNLWADFTAWFRHKTGSTARKK